MIESTYDSCLFHCIESFVIIDFQTDDILIFVSDDFAIKENKTIKTINIMIKKRECLITTNLIKFNDMRIELGEDGTINMRHTSHRTEHEMHMWPQSVNLRHHLTSHMQHRQSSSLQAILRH